MRFDALSATADIVGRRIVVGWEYALDALETPGDLPAVVVRRKERDFDFPPFAIGDPYLVYDDASFPPAPIPGTLIVIDLPPRETVENGHRVQHAGISVSHVTGGVPQEVLRRVVSTTLGPDAVPIRVKVEILDAAALVPRTPYYYQLEDGSAPSDQELERYRAVAVAGATHGLNRRLYEMLPEVYKKHDVRTIASEHQLVGVPETNPAGGQLRRFVDMFGVGFDAVRSSAENLLDLHDVFRGEGRFLAPLSRMIGWEPTNIFGIPLQRNELLTATRLFDVVGAIPALRALVTYQTGWHSQVTEFAQHVMRANEPPRRNVFGVEERPGLPASVWQGLDDAASVFGFPDAGAVGAGVLPAVLTSTAVEPFPLRAGMELTITVDNDVPARVRFGPDDFDDIGAATALEVCATISVAFDTIIAEPVAGAVQLRTHAVGPKAAVHVGAAATSLVALNDAPLGPLSVFADASGRIRLFYEQKLDPGRTEWVTFPGGSARMAEAEPILRSIRYKSWGHGEWRDERALPAWTGTPTAPWATQLPDERIWISWIDGRRPASSRLVYAVGQPRQASPAVITGHRSGPFALQPGTQLTLRGRFGTEVFAVLAGDYVNPAQATAAEVVVAMNGQLTQAVASAVAGGALRLTSTAIGDGALLAVDLSQSTAARALGLDSRRLAGRGGWDVTIDWSGPRRAVPLWNPLSDPSAIRDPIGGVRVFWSEHQRGRWEIRQAHWSERVTVVTPAGAAQRTTGAWQTWQIADGLPSNDVRAVAVDANGTLWFATPAGLASRRPDNTWTVLTTVDGLGSDDVRDLAFLPDGSLWCATPAGVSVLPPGGAFTVLTAAGSGLVSDDVRAVAADGRNGAWAATPAGVSFLDAAGNWRTWTVADGISPGVPRAIAAGAGRRVALATAAGVSIRVEDAWVTHTIAEGLPSNDVRAVAWGTEDELIVGTAAGIALWNGRAWRSLSTVHGLPSNDVRAAAVAPDGNFIVGTAAGVATGSESTWTVEGIATGLPSNLVAGIHTTWSAPIVLAEGAGANREPRAAVDAANRTWVVWAQRTEIMAGPRDTWTLRYRRFDPSVSPWAWEPEQAVTTSPGGGTADREPYLEPQGGGLRVFFSSDRGGGRGIWWVTVSALGVPGVPESLPNDAAETTAPAVVTGPTGRAWMFHRSDRSVVPAQVGVLSPPGTSPRASERVPDADALTLHAGCRTPVFAHAARNLGRRTWGDLFTYTPEYPHLISDDAPADDHLYTRRTIGLYLRQARTGLVVTEEQIDRLLQLLRRFLPVNLRLVLIISPDALVEFVYTPEADITDAFADNVPFFEFFSGPSDLTGVLALELAVLISNDLASLSASLTDLTTLRRRTWFPDLA
jgi:hypothetical protein